MLAHPAEHLLLIEDDVELAASLVSRLSEHGYSVKHVPDGVRGLATALEVDFDALVVDRMLPGIDGPELVRALRGTKATPVRDTKGVLVSVSDDGPGIAAAMVGSASRMRSRVFELP